MRAAASLGLVVAFVSASPTYGLRAQGVQLEPCRIASVPVELRCGTYTVFEDRAHHRGRQIPLYVRVIPSATSNPAADPLVFVSAGGPGLTNSDLVAYGYARGWRQRRDVVMVDLRGTSGPDRLDCKTPGSSTQPLGYLTSQFDSASVARCRLTLSRRADLRQYTTANAMDDLYDVLGALGYSHVNLWGASGGTREVLEFIRRHPSMVRSAIVEGTAPVAFKNPLPHAQAAQEALDSLFDQCDRDPPCHGAFPQLRAEFSRLRDATRSRAIRAEVPESIAGHDTTIDLTWPMIAETVRTMSYTAPSQRAIPYAVHQAASGDVAPLVAAGIQSSRRTRDAIRFGFLLSQTCLEDVPRITDAEIAGETANTYLGSVRVREQQAACRAWIGATEPVGDFAPVRSDIPVFLLAGTIDPVTRPRYAVDAARYLSHSQLVIAPGGHVPSGPCIDAMEEQFLARPLAPVDTLCVRAIQLPAFRLR